MNRKHYTCTVDGCGLPHAARGYCEGHYCRWKTTGDVRADIPLGAPRLSAEERFWSKVDRRAPDDCWEWMAGRSAKGYGNFTVEGREVRAHKVAYELVVGPVSDGLLLDHLCRNPPCVNPAHLEPVTAAENTRRGFAPSAINARKTHCKRGHEFTPDNTEITTDGYRRCRTCTTERTTCETQP